MRARIRRTTAWAFQTHAEAETRFLIRPKPFSGSEVYGDYEGVMLEDVTDKFSIKQMNDYAISRWVTEM